MGEGKSKNLGDFTFDHCEEENDDRYKEKAIELMCRHFEFYGQLNSPNIEYVTRGANLHYIPFLLVVEVGQIRHLVYYLLGQLDCVK